MNNATTNTTPMIDGFSNTLSKFLTQPLEVRISYIPGYVGDLTPQEESDWYAKGDSMTEKRINLESNYEQIRFGFAMVDNYTK